MNFSKETLEDDSLSEQDLRFLANCYKSREESVHSIREFYGNFSENCSKFSSFDALLKKIDYFSHEFALQNRVLVLTEEQIIEKFSNIRANSANKRQILAKFVNNLLKINTILVNKLQHAKLQEEMLDFKEILCDNALFKDNLMNILKEEAYNIAKLLGFAMKNSRNKLNFEIKRLKSTFSCSKAREFFENPANFPQFSKKTGKKKPINAKKSLPFKFDTFFFLETVRNKHIIPVISRKNADNSQKSAKNEGIYDILEVVEYRPPLICAEKSENELISEKFQRIFCELLKMNSKIAKNIKKYHKKFMKHVGNRKIQEKSQKKMGKRSISIAKL